MKSFVISILCLLYFSSNYTFSAPKIIIKLDDMNPLNSKVRGYKAMDFLIKNEVKFSFGVIANKLDKNALRTLSSYLLATDKNGDKLFEIWHHGFDHIIPEFKNRDYAYQKKHFEDADKIVLEKLKLQMNSFGTPGNASDSITNIVISENSKYHVFMLAQNIPTIQNKSLLYIDHYVEMEKGVGNVNYKYFVKNYESYKNRYTDYMILQGHPNGWTDAQLEDFKRIIFFLKTQGCEFTLPYEYYCDLVLKYPIKLNVNLITPKQTKITWIDENENIDLTYKIERSVDSTEWKLISTLKNANLNNSNNSSFYDSNIQNVDGTCFYRIRPMIGNKTGFSNVVKVSGLDINKDSGLATMEIEVSPVPSKDFALIKYQLVNSGYVKCNLYNIEGRYVKELFEDIQYKGFNQVRVDLSDLKPGIYVCEVLCQNSISKKKIIIN